MMRYSWLGYFHDCRKVLLISCSLPRFLMRWWMGWCDSWPFTLTLAVLLSSFMLSCERLS